jgi:hypothetical protein
MEKDVVKDLFKKNNAVIFFDYFVLYAKTIIFSPLSLFLGVWLNIFIMVSWFAFKQGDSFLLSSIVATGVVRNGMYTFLRSLLNIKRVGANDRLRLVPTNRAIEVSAALTWNFIYNLGSTIIFIGIALIFIPTQRVMFENINWLMYVSGYLLLWLSSVLTAYLFDCVYIFRLRVSVCISGKIWMTWYYLVHFPATVCDKYFTSRLG